MRISAKADYAVRAVIEIGLAGRSGPVTADAIAVEQSIPRTFLLAILADLRRAGVVTSRRGQTGGWVLARAADAISVADVIRAVDGPMASVQGQRPEELSYERSATALREVWVAVRASLREVLETVTIKDLVLGVLPTVVADRTRSDEAWRSH